MRPVETDETLPGGRIALVAETRERMTAWQCECVAVGKFAACEHEDIDDCERHDHAYDATIGDSNVGWHGGAVHAHDIQVGDWLLVRPRSFIAGPEPERAEWYVHQDDVLAILSED